MREIALTQGQVAIVDEEDYERVSAFKWHAWKAGNSRTYYASRTISYVDKGKRIYQKIFLHRFVMNTEDKSTFVDHVNHEGLDCRKSNLRAATQMQNLWNRRKISLCSSMFKGVYLHKTGKWVARLGKMYLGIFSSEQEAAYAYNRSASEKYGQFALLNVIR